MPASPQPPRPGAAPYHRGDLRQDLLARAEEALRSSGVDGISLRQLARETGVSHSAPNKHFRDKQALLDALAVEGFTRLGASFARLDVGPDVTARLHAIGRCYIRFASDNPALVALMFARKHSTEGDSRIAEQALLAFAVPVAAIEEGQARGDVVAGDPIQIGMSVLATLHGLATFISSGFVDEGSADALLSETLHHLTHGLQPRP